MSTQAASSIDFSIALELSHFQLFELPDDLLAIIANHKDETPVLQLKSEAQSSNAVLCSPNATFSLRSVQTSNSLFVVQPIEAVGYDEDTIPSAGLQAISRSGMTLELSRSSESALPYLKKILPVYTERELTAAAAVKGTFDEICKDVPLSDGEVQAGWTELCAFEEQGASFRPSVNILHKLWASMSTAATADSLDLSAAFLVEDLWIQIRDEDYPRGLYDALLRRVEDGDVMEVDSNLNWCTIDKVKCSQLLASLILESQTMNSKSMILTEFMVAWEIMIPERWRGDLSIDVMQTLIIQPSSNTIALKPKYRLSGPVNTLSTAAEPTAPTAKKGKWHEKFRKTRA